jgi:hypothetical protein
MPLKPRPPKGLRPKHVYVRNRKRQVKKVRPQVPNRQGLIAFIFWLEYTALRYRMCHQTRYFIYKKKY